MKAPFFLSLAGILVVFAGLGSAYHQGKATRALREELAVLAGALAAPAPVAEAAPAAPAEEPLTDAERLELLRLRGQVTKLRGEARGLAAAEQENASLKQRVATAKANPAAAAGIALPPGYILRRTARNAGQATPEATVETFLWAVEHRDLNVLMQTLAPADAQKFAEMVQRAGQQGEDFWQGAAKIPGMRVSDQKTLSDGSVELKLSVDIEGSSDQQTTKARLVDGRWRIELR